MWFSWSWYDITGELSVLAVQQNGRWFLTQLVSHVNYHTLRVPFFMWSNSSNPGGVFWRVFNSATEFHICFQNFYIIRKFLWNNFDKCFSCNSSWSSKNSSAIAVDSPPSNALEVSAQPRFWPATNELLAVLVEESVDWQTIWNRIISTSWVSCNIKDINHCIDELWAKKPGISGLRLSELLL